MIVATLIATVVVAAGLAMVFLATRRRRKAGGSDARCIAGKAPILPEPLQEIDARGFTKVEEVHYSFVGGAGFGTKYLLGDSILEVISGPVRMLKLSFNNRLDPTLEIVGTGKFLSEAEKLISASSADEARGGFSAVRDDDATRRFRRVQAALSTNRRSGSSQVLTLANPVLSQVVEVRADEHTQVLQWVKEIKIERALLRIFGEHPRSTLQGGCLVVRLNPGSHDEQSLYIDAMFPVWRTLVRPTRVREPKNIAVATEADALREYARAINRRNGQTLFRVLSEDFTYESQAVLEPLVGADAFRRYFEEVLANMRESSHHLSAEMADHRGRPCLVIEEGSPGSLSCLVFAKVNGGRIARLDLCIVPPPEVARRTGERPGST